MILRKAAPISAMWSALLWISVAAVVVECANYKYPPRSQSQLTLTESSPRFVTHARKEHAPFLGSDLKLNCRAVAKPVPYVFWFRNGNMIPESHESRLMLSDDKMVLSIRRVEVPDHGQWACKVWNSAGQIWRNFTVEVLDRCRYYEQVHQADSTIPIPVDCQCLKLFGYDRPSADARSLQSSLDMTLCAFLYPTKYRQWKVRWSAPGTMPFDKLPAAPSRVTACDPNNNSIQCDPSPDPVPNVDDNRDAALMADWLSEVHDLPLAIAPYFSESEQAALRALMVDSKEQDAPLLTANQVRAALDLSNEQHANAEPEIDHEQPQQLPPPPAVRDRDYGYDESPYIPPQRHRPFMLRAPYFKDESRDDGVLPDESAVARTVAVPSGRTVKLQCNAQGYPEPQVVFYRHTDPNGVKGNFTEILEGAQRPSSLKYKVGRHSLQLVDAVQSDSGLFACMAYNSLGNVTRRFKLKVIDRLRSRPIISRDYPKNESVQLGANVTVQCPIISDLTAHVTFYKIHNLNFSGVITPDDVYSIQFLNDNDTHRAAGEEPRFQFLRRTPSDADSLLISNFHESDVGPYICVAGNGLGMAHAIGYLSLADIPVKPAVVVWPWLVFLPVLIVLLALVLLILFLCRKTRSNNVQPVAVYVRHGDYENDKHSQSLLLPVLRLETKDGGKVSDDVAQQLATNVRMQFDVKDGWTQIPQQNIQTHGIVGEGAFGVVYHGELCDPVLTLGQHMPVAVKTPRATANVEQVQEMYKELLVMQELGHHTNIINLIGFSFRPMGFQKHNQLQIIMEYCANGNLRDFLRNRRPGHQSELCVEGERESDEHEYLLPRSACAGSTAAPSMMHSTGVVPPQATQCSALCQADLIDYARQVARGMQYLASKHCLHRDVAARNVLVTADLVMKVADFGLARDSHDTHNGYYQMLNNNKKVPWKWMAPEALNTDIRKCSIEGDVWAFGVLFWEIMTMGGTPYTDLPAVNPSNLLEYLQSGYRLPQPVECLQPAYMLMQSCWDMSPMARPQFSQIVQYLNDVLEFESKNAELAAASACMSVVQSQSQSQSIQSLCTDVYDMSTTPTTTNQHTPLPHCQPINTQGDNDLHRSHSADHSTTDEHTAALYANLGSALPQTKACDSYYTNVHVPLFGGSEQSVAYANTGHTNMAQIHGHAQAQAQTATTLGSNNSSTRSVLSSSGISSGCSAMNSPMELQAPSCVLGSGTGTSTMDSDSTPTSVHSTHTILHNDNGHTNTAQAQFPTERMHRERTHDSGVHTAGCSTMDSQSTHGLNGTSPSVSASDSDECLSVVSSQSQCSASANMPESAQLLMHSRKNPAMRTSVSNGNESLYTSIVRANMMSQQQEPAQPPVSNTYVNTALIPTNRRFSFGLANQRRASFGQANQRRALNDGQVSASSSGRGSSMLYSSEDSAQEHSFDIQTQSHSLGVGGTDSIGATAMHGNTIHTAQL